jgi:hypothetical protein
MKTVAVLASLVVSAFAAAPVQGAADSGSTQVLLQRTPDGRVILTDRPLEGATTQRTWQVPHEDPAAARDRGERVRAEADAVSERIAKRMLAEEEMAARRDLERMRLAALDSPRDADLQDSGYGYWGGYLGGGWWGVGPPIHRPIRPRPGFGKPLPNAMNNRSSFPVRPDFLPQGPPPVVGRLR